MVIFSSPPIVMFTFPSPTVVPVGERRSVPLMTRVSGIFTVSDSVGANAPRSSAGASLVSTSYAPPASWRIRSTRIRLSLNPTLPWITGRIRSPVIRRSVSTFSSARRLSATSKRSDVIVMFTSRGLPGSTASCPSIRNRFPSSSTRWNSRMCASAPSKVISVSNPV